MFSVFAVVAPGTSVSRPGDRFVSNAIVEATRRVNSAVNNTLIQLFDRSRHHTVSDLIAAFRLVPWHFMRAIYLEGGVRVNSGPNCSLNICSLGELNNNRLFIVPCLVGAQSAYRALRIHSLHHTHMCMRTRTHTHTHTHAQTHASTCTHTLQIHALPVMGWFKVTGKVLKPAGLMSCCSDSK